MNVDANDLIAVLQERLGLYLSEVTILKAACRDFERSLAEKDKRIAELGRRRRSKQAAPD